MITYRPTPALIAGRKGFRAAVGAMALAAVIGTTAFAPADAGAVAASPTLDAVVLGTAPAADEDIARRQDL
ncbi:hypothetical protein FJV46_06055 [Arthrobacter agilis]|uniref:hypothetical protein n=1 Tax=Arthrobacter agilis TaxID=37921 RepID=UPI000B3501D9|nr:hypothetical protein [Arthrobacter agilis]OUM42235.1 hypothetical protein B8W74_09010 [Arthrobacter agilis]PPB45577.1 hypothetical protein CI784_11010 [Arthrobacter agilis]TPV26442.1 hypothetical protein FJV46_06055 [Arthrobacter agilis]VDR33660.1 Uncharacterised protein [Arthrobacter agilis]